MASNADFVQYIVDQCSGAGDITVKKMMGDYCIYCDGVIFGLVCDNNLYIKPTSQGAERLKEVVTRSPYQGAKEHFLITDVDDRDYLTAIIKATIPALPNKEGSSWKCCFDPETGLYTAQVGGGVNCKLFEITKEIYDRVDDPDLEWPSRLIHEGRMLFMSVNDRCGPPYTIVFDSDYKKLCPWSDACVSGETWPDEMTDAVVEVLESQKNNREQRRKKREGQNKK